MYTLPHSQGILYIPGVLNPVGSFVGLSIGSPIESSETSAYNNTLTPGTYPKEKKLHNLHLSKIRIPNLPSNHKAQNTRVEDALSVPTLDADKNHFSVMC